MTLIVSAPTTVFAQRTHFYFETLHNHSGSSLPRSPSSRRSDKRVSLVRRSSNNTTKFLSPPMIVAGAAQAERRKKSVRFSDTVAQVRLFYQSEAPHRRQMPTAEEDADVVATALPPSKLQFALEPITTAACFHYNNSNRPIQLERVALTPEQVVAGQCRVVNLAFEKHVMVRYSLDNWATFRDVDANFRESCTSSDLFDFEIPLFNGGSSAAQAKELQLSLRYCVNGFEFWDNNNGRNYRHQIVCRPEPTMSMTAKSRKIPPPPVVIHRATSDPVDLVSYQYFYRTPANPLCRNRIA